ncbi:MAG: NAD(P)-dependent oxidoreductase [Bacteroidia bacterium]
MPTSVFGVIAEKKEEPDKRTPLTPIQAAELMAHFPKLTIIVEPSEFRCFTNEEYEAKGVTVSTDLSKCSLLMGVKEVPVEEMLEQKTYMFFSHTMKEQEYNRDMLRAILEKKICLIDYEVLMDSSENRLIGFGRFAGLVGGHYAMLMYGKRTGAYKIKPAAQCDGLKEMLREYKSIELPAMKIVLTGSGRVAGGVCELLDEIGVTSVTPEDFLNKTFEGPVYTQLFSQDLFRHKYNFGYDRDDFHQKPDEYKSLFQPYAEVADVLINGIYWNPAAPPLFTKEDAKKSSFRIRTIADITSDIQGSVPITLKFTTTADPVCGYNPFEDANEAPYQPHTIDIMSVVNLPNELPKDASREFGEALSTQVLPRFHVNPGDKLFERATIAQDGHLTKDFQYLEDFVRDK